MTTRRRIVAVAMAAAVVAGGVGAPSAPAQAPGTGGGEPQIESARARACDPACRAAKLAGGELTGHVMVTPDGRPRTYWLYEPAGLAPGEPVPLLFVLHGGGGDGLMYADETGFDAIAKEEGFVVVYPDGWLRTWNAGHCCGRAQKDNVDDVGFLEAIVEEVSARRAVDPLRVYATGHSNGSMLAGVVACTSVRFAAVVGVAGPAAPCDPLIPVSVLLIHGTGDRNAPYEGGQGPNSIAGVDHPAVRPTVERWWERNACPPADVTTVGLVTTELSSPCLASSGVGLITIEGGEHPWPGSSGSSLQGRWPSQALDASLAAWEFLAAHPRRAGL